MVLEDAMSMNN